MSFVRGQPLGYYSSWGLFSLSHHILVWVAAKKATLFRRKFTDYALLGDDIVIADQKVAEEYRKIMDYLGVEISIQK